MQAAALVRELAQTNRFNEDAFQSSIYSIFQTEAGDVPTIFGNITGIKYGLEKLIATFTPNTIQDPIQTRYIFSLIHLQKRVFHSPDLVKALTNRVTQIKKQVEYFSLVHPTVIANLAEAYLTAVNAFKFRIVVWGNQRILSAPENMDRIRALLLAGIRSTVLWRQLGGSRLQFIFSRKKIKLAAEKLLLEIEKGQLP